LPPLDWTTLVKDQLVVFFMANGEGHSEWYLGRIENIDRENQTVAIHPYNYRRGPQNSPLDLQHRQYKPTWVDVRTGKEALAAKPKRYERMEYINVRPSQILIGPITLQRGQLDEATIHCLETMPPLPPPPEESVD
jgi:hypothetical protein